MTRRGKKVKLPAPAVFPSWVWSGVGRVPPVRLLITGTPRTKKNDRATLILPSKAWMRWVKEAEVWIVAPAARPLHCPKVPNADAWYWPLRCSEAMLPDTPYNCQATFYRHALVGDAVGFYQGLADLLEKRGVLTDDKWITQWDGSRLRKDPDRTRVELELTPLDPLQLAHLLLPADPDAEVRRQSYEARFARLRRPAADPLV